MLENIKDVLWAIVTVFIITSGLYFSFKLKFPQIRFIKIIKSLKSENKYGISPIKTLFLTLAGRIGVGSIAGVALAIYVGGAGTIFWMWIIAIISGSLAYAETLLAIKYKDTKKDIGGPPYYIKKGINKKTLALVYALVVIIAYIIGFIPIQSNTIVKMTDTLVINNHFIIGLILAILSFIIIKGGIQKISKVTDKMVPFMALLYVGMSLYVIVTNLEIFTSVIKTIINEAFNLKPFFTGFIVTILIGVQRAIFSNESGIGLGGIAASASNSINGSKSGYVQVLGIYITTLLICTATAFMILIFNYKDINLINPNGIELTSLAFFYHFGHKGNILLAICIFLFSFSTILTGFYYCEASIKFLFGKDIIGLKLLVPISVLIGTVTSPTILWSFIDILVGALALINIYAMIKLRAEIMNYHKKYGRI